MSYRLIVALRDGRILNEFAADELSGLAWKERRWFPNPNIFNAFGYQRPETVRNVTITGSEPPTKARARFYREWRS